MQPRLPILAVLVLAAALALSACGGDDETSAETTATDAATSTSTEAGGEMTAGDYMAASLPDQIKVVKELVAANPDECAGVDPKPGGDFQVAFAIDAAQATPDTPLSEIIVQSCAEAGNGTS